MKSSGLVPLLFTAVVLGILVISRPPIAAQPAGGLQLPFAGSARSDGGAVFRVKNLSGSETSQGVSAEGKIGLVGHTSDQNGTAILGFGSIGDHSAGVRGQTEGKGTGVEGDSRLGRGVKGTNASLGGGVATWGTLGDSDAGVKGGTTNGPTGFIGGRKVGVEGKSDIAGGFGVGGRGEGGPNSVGVYGESTSGIAGFFRGRVTITQSLLVDTIFAKMIGGGEKLFRIDHPLEPATKYLSHASVESNELTDLYSGNVILGPGGAAWVGLPRWFEALNTDFRYQLTCLGGFAHVYVAQEIKDSRFRIAGGRPGLKVSWQITAVRQDAYAKAHPLRVEEQKPAEERGRYLNPLELGFAASRGIGYNEVSRIEDPSRLLASRRRSFKH